MEKKKISGKLIGIIVSAVAVVAVGAVLLAMHFSKTPDSYRSIQIYDMEGTATIERETIGQVDAVENLYLESGDRIFVAEDSYVRLKLDDDKYVMVEENSVLSIVAEGTKEDSKTSITLEQGAITNEIQNKLNENSSYEVTTPNSVMAVRGTVFRVEITYDENGDIYTKISTFEGGVDTRLVFPDGTVSEEAVLVEEGQEVYIQMDSEDTEYLSSPQNIDYTVLPIQVLETLKSIMENGTKLVGINLEEIEQLLEGEEVTEETEEKESAGTEEETEEKEEEKKISLKKEAQKSEETSTKEVTGEIVEQVESVVEETKSYTVTFVYNNTTFGTQTVKEGEQATIPKLAPAESGAWDFDFSQKITGDITVYWK